MSVLSLLAAAAVLAVQLTFSYAQLESGDFENCTTGCSLSIESLLLNSAIHPDMIDRTYVWATTFSLQSNGTHSASVVAVYANRTPIVCASGEPALCAVAAASLELHCADGREWTVASERNCSFLATCNTFNSSSDLYLIDWGRSSNCAANEPSNFSCASPPNIAGCPYCNDAFNECASLALPAAGCKPGATANVSSSSSFLSQTGQIVVIAVGGGSVILNTVLISTVCVICCANCKRRKEGNGQAGRNPTLFNVTQNNLTSSPSSQNLHLVDFASPHNVSTFRPVQSHELNDTGLLTSRKK